MAKSLDILEHEHEEILERLEKESNKGGETSRVFAEILSRFTRHLEEENETIVPLLHFIKRRSQGENLVQSLDYNEASNKFQRDFALMMKEHEIIQELIKKAQELSISTPDSESKEVCNELLHHIELEEEFLYPAARVAGELIRLERQREVEGAIRTG